MDKHNICQQLYTQYITLDPLVKEVKNVFQQDVTLKDFSRTKALKEDIQIKISELRTQLPSREIKVDWKDLETNESREINIDIDKELLFFQEFYKRTLGIELGEKEKRETKAIWRRNKEEIQKEMETYGYDMVLVIPGSLPGPEELNKKLIETMKEVDGKVVNSTYQTISPSKKPFQEIKNLEEYHQNKLRLLLIKNGGNEQKDFITKITSKFRPLTGLTGLEEQEIRQRIAERQSLPVYFSDMVNGKAVSIEAEGISFAEFLIYQRVVFEKTQQHPVTGDGTWILKSFTPTVFGTDMILGSVWDQDESRLEVEALFEHATGILICRTFF